MEKHSQPQPNRPFENSAEQMLRERNMAQINLAEDAHMELEDWVPKFAERFDQLWTEEVADEYHLDEAKTLQKLKQQLYH